MRYDEDILAMSSDLAIGDRSEHLVCPACNGGAMRERSLLIWCDADGLAYKCYRAKCGIGGKVGSTGYRPSVTKKRKPRFNTKDLHAEALPDDVTYWLLSKFDWLTREMLYINRVQWSEVRERVLYPIRSLSGYDEGYMARRYDELVLCSNNRVGAKALAYFNSMPEDYTLTGMMCPHGSKFTNHVAVVEDYPSALRLNSDIPAIALSGTSLQESVLIELIRGGKTNVCFVLDADATAKAASIVYKHSLYFKSLSFLPLSGADIKDMSTDSFNRLIVDIKKQLRI